MSKKNTSEFIEQFNPKKHPKYSENIYRWLKSTAKRYGQGWEKESGKVVYDYSKGSEYLKEFQLYRGVASIWP